MKSLKPLYLILYIALFVVRCSPSPVDQALLQLDEVIASKQLYLDRFEARNDSLRLALGEATSDSVRWAVANDLYESYLHFSVDSAGRYIFLMKDWAGTEKQRLVSQLEESRLWGVINYEEIALSLYQAIDQARVQEVGLSEQYLSVGVTIFTNLSRYPRPFHEDMNYTDSLIAYRAAYIARDTLSYEGRKLHAQSLRDAGEFDKAMSIFLDCFSPSLEDYHTLTSIAFNLALLYGLKGDEDSKIVWLSRSAQYDFKAPNRDFLSLYELALALYRKGDYTRAGSYIKLHFENVYEGDFQAKAIRSSGAQNYIVEESIRVEQSKRNILQWSLVIFAVLIIITVRMWMLTRRQARRLSLVNGFLGESNRKLEVVNKALVQANKIKDNYVFRYMNLSLTYLDRVEDNRHNLRRIAKEEGTAALLKELRSASSFAPYKEFYQVFDTTFLGIFPRFVDDVNALLREEARFCVRPGDVLPTEIRILAAIKLGISDSPRISSFLKCSLSTVYTYRAKMRNQALCPKEEFEERVKNL